MLTMSGSKRVTDLCKSPCCVSEQPDPLCQNSVQYVLQLDTSLHVLLNINLFKQNTEIQELDR